MASVTREESPQEGTEVIHEDDGQVTARDLETAVASFGETKTEALRVLSEALELHEGTESQSLTKILKSVGLMMFSLEIRNFLSLSSRWSGGIPPDVKSHL